MIVVKEKFFYKRNSYIKNRNQFIRVGFEATFYKTACFKKSKEKETKKSPCFLLVFGSTLNIS